MAQNPITTAPTGQTPAKTFKALQADATGHLLPRVAQSYETVAASQTAQVLGATGATGDYLDHLLIVPGTTSPGAVSIKDGSGSDITLFTGGATSVADLAPVEVPIRANSAAGAWAVTTGANVSVVAVGNFT